MGMALRSYQHFESGKGKFLNRDNIFRFADATDSDAEAIIFAIDIGDPLFAVYCADNKFMKVLHFAVKDFNRRAGPRIGALRTAALITTFSVLFEDLTAQAEKEGRDVAEWLVEYERRLGKLRTQRE